MCDVESAASLDMLRTAVATSGPGRVETASCGTPSVSIEKKTISELVCRRSRATNAVSILSAAETTASVVALPGLATGIATA